ncbi:hypothetical protein D7S43_11320 [Alcaligenes faecalis]|nr:hypothetical protein D7S43_11320 [Alcaligenes faecalis]
MFGQRLWHLPQSFQPSVRSHGLRPLHPVKGQTLQHGLRRTICVLIHHHRIFQLPPGSGHQGKAARQLPAQGRITVDIRPGAGRSHRIVHILLWSRTRFIKCHPLSTRLRQTALVQVLFQRQ